MGLDSLDRGELLPTPAAYQVLGTVLTRIEIDGGMFCSIFTARQFSVQDEAPFRLAGRSAAAVWFHSYLCIFRKEHGAANYGGREERGRLRVFV